MHLHRHKTHWLVRFCMGLPLWLPVDIHHNRYGWDTDSYVTISIRPMRYWFRIR